MIAASLIWGSTGWVWPAAILGCSVLAILAWGYHRAPGSIGLRLTAAALKATGVVALALCLIEPLISGTRPKPGANTFVVLIDDSQSLQIRDSGAQKSRAELLHAQLADNPVWQTRLEQDFDVRNYRFAQRMQSLDDPAELTAEGVGSSLGSSLATVASRFRDQPVAGVLLLTDGNATDLADGTIDYDALPPIYPVPLGSASAVRDVRVGQVTVSQTNFEEAPVTIRARIEADGYDGQNVVVELFDDSDELLEEQTVRINPDEPAVLRFRLRPERAGVSFYRLRAAAESERWQFDESQQGPERSPEATLHNNTRLVTVDRAGGPYRVLYVSGRPNWEFKFLRRALDADPEVELVGLIRIAKREPKFTFLGRGGDSSNPLFKGFDDNDVEDSEQYDEPVLIRLGTQDEVELRDGFPKTADALFAYHAIILDDVESAFFTQDQMLLVQEFVSRRGGGLLMLGGAESFYQGEYHRTPLGEILPVYLDRPPAAEPDARYKLALTREGWLQPWVRLRETEQIERSRRVAMPPLKTLNRTGRIKPGSTVLAHAVDQQGTRHPALVTQRFGKGRSAALLAGDLWRWSIQRKPSEQDDLAKAWRQTVRWLVADVPQRVELDVKRRSGEPLELSVDVLDPEFKPLDNADVKLIVTTPTGERQTLEASESDDHAGRYVATYAAHEPGAYQARAEVTAADASDVGSRLAGWTAEPAAEEFRRLQANLPLLERLAKETDGEVARLDRLEPFVADLPNRKIPVTEPWIYPLWHQPLVFLFAILCLVAEWGLRRWKGLP